LFPPALCARKIYGGEQALYLRLKQFGRWAPQPIAASIRAAVKPLWKCVNVFFENLYSFFSSPTDLEFSGNDACAASHDPYQATCKLVLNQQCVLNWGRKFPSDAAKRRAA